VKPIDPKIPYGSEAYRKRNPHIFGSNRPVDSMGAKVPQQDKRGEGQNSKLESGSECRGFRIKLIQLRRRLLDAHDNQRAACKPVVDRITERLGFKDDSDPLLQWSYEQARTLGQQGLVVFIEPL
jgi:hypothetical protein